MKKLRVMMVVHHTLVPPDDLQAKDDPRMEKFRTEYDVKIALLNLGHEVQVVGVYDDLAPESRRSLGLYLRHGYVPLAGSSKTC